MPEIERKPDGSPTDWIPGGVSVSHHDQDKMQSTFQRNQNAGYMPAPFRPGLPPLDHHPTPRIYRDPPITTLDTWVIDDIKGALQNHEIGMFYSSARLADAMSGDDRIASVLSTRVKAVLGLPFSISTKKTSKDIKEADHVRRVVAREWDRMVPKAMAAELFQWGIQMGFALAEVCWEVRGKPQRWYPTIRTWHPSLCYYRYDERAFYVTTMEGPIRITPGDGKWILYAPHGEYRGWMHGTVRTCAMPWRLRTFGFRDWGRHAEKHGFPWILPRVPMASSDEDKLAFFNALNSIGGEPTIMCPEVDEHNRFDVDFKEAAHPADQVFEGLTTRCDTLISCAILGQNLTTEVQGGSYAAATVHGQVRQDYLESDCATLAQCLEQQLLRPFVAFNFEHSSKLIPTPAWDPTPPEDRESGTRVVHDIALAISTLAKVGFPLDIEEFAKRYRIPIDMSKPAQLIPRADAQPADVPEGMSMLAVADLNRKLDAMIKRLSTR